MDTRAPVGGSVVFDYVILRIIIARIRLMEIRRTIDILF